MTARELSGDPASPGAAIGPAYVWRAPAGGGQAVPVQERTEEIDRALAALDGAADGLKALAGEFSGPEAEILEAGALMAQDPQLTLAVREAITSRGLPAAGAILQATDAYADAIAAVGDPRLAARADDVRSLGRRAAQLSTGGGASGPAAPDAILVAHDIGPADVAEMAPRLAGVALVAGGATAHAAIVARSLGIPMVTGLGGELLDAVEAAPLVVDGTAGSVVLDPPWQLAAQVAEQMRSRRRAQSHAAAQANLPAMTLDGHRIEVLANVAGAAELAAALKLGAEGIGLLRTELAFLEANEWPTEQQHTDVLQPILDGLGDRRAVVRVLDFGADKAPPFLAGTAVRGIELLLAHEDAFLSQLRAILRLGRGRRLEVLLPMVDDAGQVRRTRSLIRRAAGELGIGELPPLGSMIETPPAADHAESIAAQCAFLSIGTNDLTAATLGSDRFASSAARGHDPRVLRLISRSVAAAHEAAIPIEVCGEAASDPLMLPLLVGLGVDELSVGAAQVGLVRERIRKLNLADAGRLAKSALALDSAEEVEQLIDGAGAAQVGLRLR